MNAQTDSLGTVVAPIPPQQAQPKPTGLPGDPVPRVMPQNEEAEQALLGALMLDNKVYGRFSEFLRPEHFFVPVHGRIYEAAATLIERGQVATPVTLKAYFQADADLAHLGGGEYLSDLMGAVVTVRSAEDFAHSTIDLYLRRQLISLADEIVCEAQKFTTDTTATKLLEQHEGRLFALAETGTISIGRTLTFSQSMKLAIARAESAWQGTGVAGVSTGFREIDQKLGGLHPSDLIILAGRPSMGKTALATNMAFNAARNGPVLFFSLEMSAEQLATRILADRTGISSERIRKGDINQHEFHRLCDAQKELDALPLFIDDTPALSINAMRARARRMHRQYGLKLIVVDYLQLLSGSAAGAQTIGSTRFPRSRAGSKPSPRNSTCRCWRCRSFRARSRSAPTNGPSFPICASPVRSSRTPMS
jgi:replicative DNA helicase